MFSKKFKLFATMVGLVAVLAMGLAMPGATQQNQIPSRGQIVQGLSQLISATLTASEGDILDAENSSFYSLSLHIDHSNPQRTVPMTFAHIPLHVSSRSARLLYNWATEGEPFGEYLNFGALYLGSDPPGCPGYDRLTPGLYQLKVNNDLTLIAIDSEGREFTIGYIERRIRSSLTTMTDGETDLLAPPWVVLGVVCLTTALAGHDFCICDGYTCYTEVVDGKPVTKCVPKCTCIGCAGRR